MVPDPVPSLGRRRGLAPAGLVERGQRSLPPMAKGAVRRRRRRRRGGAGGRRDAARWKRAGRARRDGRRLPEQRDLLACQVVLRRGTWRAWPPALLPSPTHIAPRRQGASRCLTRTYNASPLGASALAALTSSCLLSTSASLLCSPVCALPTCSGGFMWPNMDSRLLTLLAFSISVMAAPLRVRDGTEE